MNDVVLGVMRKHKIKQWQVAEEIGYSEYTLSKWMRHELSKEKQRDILEAIEQIVQRRKVEEVND